MPSGTVEAGSKRTYRSQIRERQARETRERILVAATAEFERSGYTATRIRGVAQAARVSVAAVELAFGSKSQLLHAAISFAIRGDAEPVPMLKRPWAQRALDVASVAEFLEIVASVMVAGQERSAGLIIAAFEAANQDRASSELADRLRSQRAETAAWIADGLIARASLRPGITRRRATDTIWLLMDPHGFRALIRDRGWTPRQFEVWFIDSVARLLLAPKEKRRTR